MALQEHALTQCLLKSKLRIVDNWRVIPAGADVAVCRNIETY